MDENIMQNNDENMEKSTGQSEFLPEISTEVSAEVSGEISDDILSPELVEMESSTPGEPEQSSKKKNWLVIPLIAILAVLAIGAAYIGGRLLTNKTVAVQNGPVVLGDGSSVQAVSVEMERPEELPERSPEAFGIFDHRKDNTVYIRQMNTEGGGVMISMDSEGNIQDNNSSSKLVEVLVTRDTLIYHDKSLDNFDPSSSEPVEAVLEPATLEDIGENSSLIVWGRYEGDRLIAEVINYIG